MKKVAAFAFTILTVLFMARAEADSHIEPSPVPSFDDSDPTLAQKVAFVAGSLLNQFQDAVSFTSFSTDAVDLKDLDQSLSSGSFTAWDGMAQLNMRRYVNSLPRVINNQHYYVNDVFRLYYRGGPKLAVSVLPYLSVGGGVQASVGRAFSVIRPTHDSVKGFLDKYWDRYKLPWQSLDEDSLKEYFDKPEGYGFMITDYVDITASVDIHAQLPQFSVFQMSLGNNMEVRRYWGGSRIIYRDTPNTLKMIREKENGTAFDDTLSFKLGVGLGKKGPVIPITLHFLKVKREKSKIIRTVYHFNRKEIGNAESEAALTYLLGQFVAPNSKIRAPDYQLETKANYEQIESAPLGLTIFERKRGFEQMKYNNAQTEKDEFLLHAFSIRNVANSRRVSIDWKALLNENQEASLSESDNTTLQIHIERHPTQMKVKTFKKVEDYFNELTGQELISCRPSGKDSRKLGPKYMSLDIQFEKEGLEEAMNLSDAELCTRISPETPNICKDPLLSKKSGARGWFKYANDGEAMQWRRIRKILDIFHDLKNDPEKNIARKIVNKIEHHTRPERVKFMKMFFQSIRKDKRSNQILVAGGSDSPKDCNGVYGEGKPFAKDLFFAIDEEAILLSEPIEFGVAHSQRLGRPMREFFKFDM